MLLDLSALKVRPAQFRAIVQPESRVFGPQIVEDIMLRSTMKTITRYYLDETVVRWLPESILELCSYQPKKDYRQGATGKNSALVPMPTAGCLLRKRLAQYPSVVHFN